MNNNIEFFFELKKTNKKIIQLIEEEINLYNETMGFISDNCEYNYIIRTNISTILNIPKILEYCYNLPRYNIYTGYILNLQWLDPSSGIFDTSFFNTYFASGTCIILSLDIAKFDSKSSKVMVPGLLEAHYSPNARVILNGVPQSGDGFIALANIPTPIGTVRLASPKDNNEYAHELYNALRLADNKGIKTVQVIPPVEQGIGVAINNRLNKAAH